MPTRPEEASSTWRISNALVSRRAMTIPPLPEWAPQPGLIHAVFPSRRGLLPSVRALLDFLAAEFVALSRTDLAK